LQLGEHPDDGELIQANSGRFGPYVVHRSLYATLPKGRTPQDVTYGEALDLISAKAERLRAKGRDPYAVSRDMAHVVLVYVC
jgi:DNA topoisomerase-1